MLKLKTIKYLFFKIIGINIHYPVKKGKKTDFIFVHIPKTAGTSIVDFLGLYSKKHLTLIQIKELVGLDWYRSFKFSFVRNPYDRAVSQYFQQQRVAKRIGIKNYKVSFEEWVINCFERKNKKYMKWDLGFLTQYDWLKNHKGEIELDYIFKFESLENDTKLLSKIIGTKAVLNHKNKIERKNYKNYYTPKSKQIIEKYFKNDFVNFNYLIEDF